MNKTKFMLNKTVSGKSDTNETENISAFIDSEMGIILDEALLRAKLKKAQKFQERSQNSK